MERASMDELAALLGADERPAATAIAPTLRPGEVVAATHDGQPVALARLADGSLIAVADACPHDRSPLSDGFVDGDMLVCQRHGWEINLRTGECPNRRSVRCALIAVAPASADDDAAEPDD